MDTLITAGIAAGISALAIVILFIYWAQWKKQQVQLLEILQQILVAANSGGDGDGGLKHKEILEKFRDALISIEKKVSSGRGGGGGDMASSTKMAKMLEGIRDYLADGKAHQVRLQEGYDYAVLKNFCKQVIRCIHRSEVVQAGNEQETLEGVKTDLLDLLERNGIERFEPAKGQAFSKLRKVARVLPQKAQTNDDALVGTVAEVVSPGYLYTYNDDKQRLIFPAEVKIFEKGK